MRKFFLKSWLGISALCLIILNPCFAAVDFDGTDDSFCLDNPSSSGLPTQHPLSITAWIYPDVITVGNIFAFGERNTDVDGVSTGYRLTLLTANEVRYTSLGVKDYSSTTFTTVTGEWQFVAVSIDSGDDATLYHYRLSTDTWTSEAVTHTADMNVPASTSDLMIGALHTTNSQVCSSLAGLFNGKIDDVQVYNTNLSQTQIEQIAESHIKGIDISPANRVINFLFDEQPDGDSFDGDIIKNRTGNSVNYNLTGSDGANNTGLTAKAEEVLSYP